MADVIPDPAISAADAAEICAQPWPTPDAAREQLRILRAGGWAVLESTGATPRPDGLVVVASVYHPVTWESPGDLLSHPADPDPDRTGGVDHDTATVTVPGRHDPAEPGGCTPTT